MTEYLIRFKFPEETLPVFAGWYKGGLGYAPTARTAARFDTAEQASATLTNGYGPEIASYGEVGYFGGPLWHSAENGGGRPEAASNAGASRGPLYSIRQGE